MFVRVKRVKVMVMIVIGWYFEFDEVIGDFVVEVVFGGDLGIIIVEIVVEVLFVFDLVLLLLILILGVVVVLLVFEMVIVGLVVKLYVFIIMDRLLMLLSVVGVEL